MLKLKVINPIKQNLYLILPEDIWVSIFNYLQCRDVRKLYNMSKFFKQLCIKNNIIEKKMKFNNFPRTDGYAKLHDLSKLRTPKNLSAKILFKKTISNKNNDMLDNALTYLYNNNIDIVRGDFIQFDKIR